MSTEAKYKGLMADIPEDARPREKALALGMGALSDVELMAIVFSTGIKGKGVMDLCRDILGEYGYHLSKISSMPARDFIRNHKGIGPAKALTLLAGIELGLRAAADAVKVEEKKITSSQTAFDYMQHHLYNLDHEEFWVLLLRNNLTPMREFRVGQGGIAATFVDVKLIMKEALLSNATSMMLFHNHPSGALEASAQDRALTKKIVDAARYFDIRVLDHIIVGKSKYFSFHDEGLM
ncbi:MAG: DNA repair protein RadC [Bacteroidales bacterium]|nr:DNA repair protein RadC [Bacteroidales bacterium]